MNIADFIGIIIIVLMALWGMKKGLVRSVFSLSSLVLSLILALTLYTPVSNFMETSVVGDYVRLNVYKVFDSQEIETEDPTEAGEVLKLPQSLQNTLTDTVNKATDTIRDTLAENAASLALKLLGILIVFVMVRIILWILLKLLDAVAKLPVIRKFNSLLGGVMGIAYGMLIIYIILALLTFTTTLKTFNKPTELVLESKYISQMYNQNILLNFLK
ncbi:MAG: CvpA family protein [Clostridia bacterium]|nr:CvpA family protein [Clostridia bacterium]